MWTSYIMLFFVILFDRSKLDTWASYKLKDIHLYNCKWQLHMLWIIICRSYMCLCVCACAVCISSRLGQRESRESVIIMSLKRVASGTWGPSSSTWGWGGQVAPREMDGQCFEYKLASIPHRSPGCLPFTSGPRGTARMGEMKWEQVVVCRLTRNGGPLQICESTANWVVWICLRNRTPNRLLTDLNGLHTVTKNKRAWHINILFWFNL